MMMWMASLTLQMKIPVVATNRSPGSHGSQITARALGLTNLGDQFVSKHHSDTNGLLG